MTQPTQTADLPKPSPDPTLLATLRELEAATAKVRQLVAALGRDNALLVKDPQGPAAWLETYLVEDVLHALGASFADVCAAQAWLGQLVPQVVSGVAGVADGSTVERVADDLAEGMARAALACDCGDCSFCKLRDARGLTIAGPEIRRRMRASIEIPKKLRRGAGLVLP